MSPCLIFLRAGDSHMLTLLVSQEEQNKRRKLEDELRTLRRAAGPGKSPLSPRE